MYQQPEQYPSSPNQPRLNPQWPPSQQTGYPPSGYLQQPQYPEQSYQQSSPFQQQYQQQAQLPQWATQPPQTPLPPSQPPRKAKVWPWYVAILVALVIGYAFGLGAGSAATASRTPSTASSTTTASNAATTDKAKPTSASAPTQAPTNGHHKVGQTITADNIWQLTVDKVATNQGNGLLTPKAGNVFLQIDVTMKNVSNETQAASSIILWTLKGQDGQKYDIALGNNTTPDGKVEAGGLLKGTLTYEVPANSKAFTLSFMSSLADDSLDIWDISA